MLPKYATKALLAKEYYLRWKYLHVINPTFWFLKESGAAACFCPSSSAVGQSLFRVI